MSAFAVLARGPWAPDQVRARWSDEHYAPPPERAAAADAAIAALRERGSPSHDGLAARLMGVEQRNGGLVVDLQPVRWALRLVEGDASCSVASTCLTRDSDGRWLAGRRAPWLSSGGGRGRAGGRSAPGARWTSARTRSTRSRASCGRSGRSSPTACAPRRSSACPTA